MTLRKNKRDIRSNEREANAIKKYIIFIAFALLQIVHANESIK